MVNGFHTPILLNVFNRPNETSKVLSVLSEIKPGVLYIHCDGARVGVEQDVENVHRVKMLIHDTISWPCDLFTLYESHNCGCGLGPANALNWFFSNVEEGIILEDDCLPNIDFFYYCEELLERYRTDSRIGIISGTCFNPVINSPDSYCFTAYAGIWGWATWRRTWALFDFNVKFDDRDFVLHVAPFLRSMQATHYWLKILHKCEADGPNRSYWDYQLHLCLMYSNKIHISPFMNLISNIGFNERATHTTDSQSKYANKPTHSILPLRHPERIVIDHSMDNRPYQVPFFKRMKRIIFAILRRVLSQ